MQLINSDLVSFQTSPDQTMEKLLLLMQLIKSDLVSFQTSPDQTMEKLIQTSEALPAAHETASVYWNSHNLVKNFLVLVSV